MAIIMLLLMSEWQKFTSDTPWLYSDTSFPHFLDEKAQDYIIRIIIIIVEIKMIYFYTVKVALLVFHYNAYRRNVEST